MKRIDTDNRGIDLLGAGRDGFRTSVPGVSAPTYVNAKWFNGVQEAVVRMIEAAGLSPSDADYDQFKSALNALFAPQSLVAKLANSADPTQGTNLLGHDGVTLRIALLGIAAQIAAVQTSQNAGVIGKDTLISLNADLAHPADSIGYVTNDPAPTNNTTYRKLGSPGTGSWQISSSSLVDLLRTMIVDILDTATENACAISDASGNAVAIFDETGKLQLVELDVPAITTNQITCNQDGPTRGDSEIYTVTDSEGNALMALDRDGLRVLQLTLGVGRVILTETPNGPLEVTDEYGNAAMQIESDGSTSFPAINVPHVFRYPGEIKPVAIPADITMIIGYGQSWATGFENYAISLTPRFDNLMFNGGVRTQYSSEDPLVVMSSFLPLVERQDDHTPEFPAFGGGGMGETTTAGALDIIKELLYAENNITPTDARCQLLGTSPGEGSASIEHLSDGSYIFDRVKKQITAGYQLAQAAGKTYCVGAITWVQGAADGANVNYPAQLEALRLSIDVYAKSVCGQSNDVQLVTWQCFPFDRGLFGADQLYYRHVTGLDQYPNIHTTGGCYHFDNSAYNGSMDAVSLHLTGPSTKWLAAYLGLVVKRVVFDKENWKPLRPLLVRRQGVLCTIDFNVPVGNLVFDTSRFHAQPNFGFNLYQSNDTEIIILEVLIVGPTRVSLRTADAIPVGAYVRYGGTQSTFGRFTGQGGNLRDVQGDLIKFDGGGWFFDMHNWCVVFKETISN